MTHPSSTLPPVPVFAPIPERLRWFVDARFGISFHWGLYSVAGRDCWVRSAEQQTIEAYDAYREHFLPDRFDPRSWARLARAAGMKYAIFTAKHHDGFCLFDSALTSYASVHSPAGRDLVREYVEAFRAEGLRVGLYYSLVDWHHPDYPHQGDRHHPDRNRPAAAGAPPPEWSRYLRYFHGQIRELLTGYGTIDLLALDFSYDQQVGERWGATDLVRMIRRLQPDIVLNDRLNNGTSANLASATPAPWCGDYDTCELNTPHRAPTNALGQILPWDLWITHNNGWGYVPADAHYKSAADVLRTLVNVVSKSGNLTLNLSPTARGELPEISSRMLASVAAWMAGNGDSIHGCGLAPFERPDWGRFTQSHDGRTLYAHILEPPMGHLTLRGLRDRVHAPRVLATGAEAFLGDYWNHPIQIFGQPDDIFLNTHRPISNTYPLADPVDTVIAMKTGAE